MNTSDELPEGVLKFLGALANDRHERPSELSRELELIPTATIDAVIDNHLEWSADDRLALLEVLAFDPRDYVRVQVAAQTARFAEPWPERLEPLLARLCIDEVTAVHRTASTSLATLLQNGEPETRSRVMSEWTRAGERGQRAAAAQALRFPFNVEDVPAALESLVNDSDADVRVAVAEAAKIRYREAPHACQAILRKLSDDPDPTVRHTARNHPVHLDA